MRPAAFLYLALDTRPCRRNEVPASRLGCVSNVATRLGQLNAADGAGTWVALLVIVVPHVLSPRAILNQWMRDARFVHTRLPYGVRSIARHYRLPYFIDAARVRANEHLARTLPATTLDELCADARDDAAAARALAVELVAERVVPATTRFKGLSFARLDRPRDRYRSSRRARRHLPRASSAPRRGAAAASASASAAVAPRTLRELVRSLEHVLRPPLART